MKLGTLSLGRFLVFIGVNINDHPTSLKWYGKIFNKILGRRYQLNKEKVEMLESQIIPYTTQIINNDEIIIRATYEIYTPTQ